MQQRDSPGERMSVRGALQTIVDVRDNGMAVVTHQGAARIWPSLVNHPLDFHYNPSTMGGAVPLGVGLAMADSSLHILVISGDGALTMNLGSLITVVAARVTNLTLIVLDNGIYEVTGGQTLAGAVAGVNYVALARSVGFPSACGYCREATWRDQITTALSAPGPRFISLRVDKALPDDLSTQVLSVSKQAERFSLAIKQTSSHGPS